MNTIEKTPSAFETLTIFHTIAFKLILILLASVAIAEERTITTLHVVKSSTGVPIDFRYNQSTSDVPGGLKSMPGCPRSIDGYPWVYYGSPLRCYLAGYQGPCSDQSSLFLEKGSSFGVCNCDCFKHEMRFVEDSADEKYSFCGLYSPMNPKSGAFDKKAKICYTFGQQGPCDKGQWLVMDRNQSSVICVPECPPFPPKYYDSKAGECKNSFFSGNGFLGSSLNPQKCVPPKVYSNVWKGCIDKPGDYLFLN